MGNACHTSTWERLSQKNCKFEASMDNLTQTMSQKIKERQAGEGWGVCGSMAGCLPGMQEALGSIPSTAKRN